jgi:hypothetical protein
MTLELPPMPKRIARLPKDARGYPVPWFVAWMHDGVPCKAGTGEPDFRVIAPRKLSIAYHQRRCWACGDFIGVHKIYVIGPMCTVNRVTSEPPCHRDCAEFAAGACPFLIRPRQKRNGKAMPAQARHAAGEMIERNPGVVCLYETRTAKPFQAGGGILFKLGEPVRVDWYAQGRIATRDEVLASIETGYPILLEMAASEGAAAVAALAGMREQALRLLPPAAPPPAP